MAVTRYRFDRYLLDPQARELLRDGEHVALPVSHVDCLIHLVRHRDRPVGRDELAAAVWDRVDVSDVSVNHAIMRLRKLFGDTGSEQKVIRTIPRLGYRWLSDTTEEIGSAQTTEFQRDGVVAGSSSSEVAPASPAGTEAQPKMAPPGGGRSRSRRLGLAMAFGLILLLGLLTTWLWQDPAGGAQEPAVAEPVHLHAIEAAVDDEPIALVLPAAADVAGDWAWLRLGLMDLIGNRLRDNGIPVTPSEVVVSLVAAANLPDRIDAWPDPSLTIRGSLMIRPEVRRADDLWLVRLHYREGEAELVVEASDTDVLAAGRQAADSLSVRRGLVPAAFREGADDQRATQTAQRIHAAVLAGQLDIARRLIADAPDSVRINPEIVLSQAAIDFFAGEYAASATSIETLLGQWPEDERPRIRARAQYQLGTAFIRMRRIEEADLAFQQVIDLVDARHDAHTLASAYTGRGVVAGMQFRLDDATRFLGQSRALHQASNDAFGVVRVDLNLAAIAFDRGQPAVALPILDNAVVQLERMAIPEARIYALRGIVDAHLMLLQVSEALASSERFWPPEKHSDNLRERWWLYLSRAVALTADGRLTAAEALIDELLQHSDPDKDRFVRTEVQALQASIALLRGYDSLAAELASQALTPALEGANRLSHATTWLTRVRALHRDGRIEVAASDVRQMREWANRQPQDWRMLFVILAEAEQAHVEGRLADALSAYDKAMERAEAVGSPENLVVVGEFLVDALIQSSQLDRANALAGLMSQWADRDWRAAWAQARVFQATGRSAHAQRLTEQARVLARERVLPAPLAAQR